jgi:hypothetical protein
MSDDEQEHLEVWQMPERLNIAEQCVVVCGGVVVVLAFLCLHVS